LIQRCLDYIHLHINEGITVSDVVKFVGVSRAHFSKTFHQKLGVSPLHYMQKLKMEQAAKLLNQTSLDITAIATSLGYPELYCFTRSFKRHYGCSPSKYRRKAIFEKLLKGNYEDPDMLRQSATKEVPQWKTSSAPTSFL
jgi:AraC-like DNA-binding protein